MDFLIDLDSGERVKLYTDKELFQKQAFFQITKILQEKMNYLQTLSDDIDISTCRVHDTIFIAGDRGAGKTAFMVNISGYMESNDSNVFKTFTFLKPVDPTLLEDNEHFLAIILGQVVSEVDSFLSVRKTNPDAEMYFKALRDVSESLKAVKDRKHEKGIEEIISSQNSLKLEQNAHVFFKIAARMTGKKAFVVLIDDIDMCFDKGYEILEVVRRYLASPYMIPVVTGDPHLYNSILLAHFQKQSGVSQPEAVQTAEQYLAKVFPNENRVFLSSIYDVFRGKKVVISVGGHQVAYNVVKDIEIRLMNLNVNQKAATLEVFTDNPRVFLQYLLKKRSEIEMVAAAFPYQQYPELAVHRPYLSSVETIQKIDAFIKGHFLSNLQLLQVTYEKTCEAYQHSNSTRQELYYNANNDKNAIVNGSYKHRHALRYIFNPSTQFPREYIVENLFVSKSAFKAEVTSLKELTSIAFRLFVYDDYYSSYQTKFLLVGGKFFELMFTSLDKNIDSGVIEDILYSPPFNSDIPKNRYMEIISNEEDEVSADVDRAYIDKLVGEIIEWRDKWIGAQLIDLLPTRFMHLSAKKYFNNLNILKIGRYEERGKAGSTGSFISGNSDIVGESLAIFFQRILTIFLNAVGSFESPKPVATINVGSSKTFSLEKLRLSDNAFKKNIAPLLSEQSFVQAFNNHPIILGLRKLDKESNLYKITVGKQERASRAKGKKSEGVKEALLRQTQQYYNKKQHDRVLVQAVDFVKKLNPQEREDLLPLLKNKNARFYKSFEKAQAKPEHSAAVKDYESILSEMDANAEK